MRKKNKKSGLISNKGKICEYFGVLLSFFGSVVLGGKHF